MHGYQITCKCGEKNEVRLWLDSDAVRTGECHFQCPVCRVKIRRKVVGTRALNPDSDELVFVPDRIVVEEV